MKKLSILAFMFALAIGASAQPSSARSSATGKTIGATARPGPTATNSTVSAPPVAKEPPVAVNGHKKK